MASQELILCIDIGGDSIKVAEFSYPQGSNMVLEKFAFCEYGGDMKEEELSDALADAMRDVILQNGFRARKVNISISGQSAFTRFVKLPQMEGSEQNVRKIVEYEAKQNIPFPMSEVVCDYQLISGGEESSEMEVLFVVVKSDVIERITQLVSELGKEVGLIEVAPTACFNSARANNVGEKDCEMILNIGGRCSTLVFIDNGRFFVRTIPIAGHSITQQLSKEFGIPFPDAEEMKRRHGFVALGGAYEEPDSEVAATASKIVRNVMTRLHGEINRSINFYRSQQKGRKPEKLYLAGGSSVMAFTPRFFSEKLRIPVEYFNPFQVVSLAPAIDKEKLAEVAHMFSEVIGLGLRNVTACPIEITLVPDAIKRQNALKGKIPYFYASAASLLLCLFVTLWGFSQQDAMAKLKLGKAKAVADEIKGMYNQVSKAKGELADAEKDYNDAKTILEDRLAWFDILKDIQSRLPDQLWITKLTSSATSSKTASQSFSNSPDFFGGMNPGDAGMGPGGPGGMGGPGMFDPFGGGGASAGKRTPSIIEWIVLEGHSYVGSDGRAWENTLINNLGKSNLFTGKIEDGVLLLEPAKGFLNISNFKIEVKLKTPIKKF